MADDQHVYGEVNNKANLRDVYRQIRKDVEDADSRSELTELYRRAGYLITLSYANSWEEKFGDEIEEIRATGEEEFARTARKINAQAKKIDTDADYDEAWGKMKAHAS